MHLTIRLGREVQGVMLVLGLALWAPGGAFGQAKPAAPAVAQTRILLVTGIDHPAHKWRQTWPVLAEALRQDARLDVYAVEDPHFLDSAALSRYAAVVMHWKDWEQPGPDKAAQENFRKFVASGKGVALVHFACGEWQGNWEEFGNVAGRVWHGQGPGKRQHDPYGLFKVEFTRSEHPIVRGLADFETSDELYVCLIGEHPIEVLAQAKSKVDAKYYPMAFVSQYEQGRAFHCTLGHDVKALSTEGTRELLRRGTAWAAGLPAVASEAKK